MLAIFGFVAFVIAGILLLVGGHYTVMMWMIIAGGLLTSANCAWGWAGPRWGHRAP